MSAALSPVRGEGAKGVRERWVLVALAVGVVAVVFGNGWGRFFSDAQPDLYLAPARVLRNALSAWLPSPYVGAPNYQSGLAPAAAVSTVLSWFGIAPWVIMRVVRVGLLILAGAGARALYRDLLDSGSVRGRTAAAVLYVANPYTVVTAASLAVMQPLAVLPWLLLFLMRALRGERTGWNVALVALVFFAMGGENAGVVAILLLGACLPALAVDAVVLRRVPLRAVLVRAVACLGAIAAVSAYWILPSLSAVGAGSAVAAGTETPAIIYATSSFAEVLRGLGGWPLYGRDGSGPFEPEFVLYIDQPLVIVATFALAVLGLLGALRGPRQRLVPLVMVVTGLVVSAGAFPFRSPTPYGRLWLWAQVHVPGVIGLRTGVKAGGVVVLGLSLLGALAFARFRVRDPRRDRFTVATIGRPVVAGALALGVVVAVLPMLDGRLFDRSFIVPAYWSQAAARLDQGDPSARVLVLPGQKLFSYRWRRPSADDPLAGLTKRRLVLPTTASTTTAPAVNFLAALDQPLERGTQRADAVSAMARYLGADQVLLRSDIVWEPSDGARPATLLRQLSADGGLAPAGAYGAPGLNTVGSTPVPPATDEAVEAGMPPVLLYGVDGPSPIVHAVPSSGGLLVVGDNTAVPSLVDLGLLDGRRPYFLAGSLTAAQEAGAVGAASAVVLTDANQRRVVNTSRLANSYGPLLAATDPLAASDALFGAADQTVLQVTGADQITATSSGSIFGPVPFGSPRLAFDGDLSSGWTAGDFGRSVGQSITVTYAHLQPVTQVRVVALPSAPVSLRAVDVEVAGVSHRVSIGAGGVGELRLGSTSTSRVKVTIAGTSGTGENAVGIAEIQVAGAGEVTPYARLPLTLERLAATPGGRAGLAALPLDVLMQRDRGLNLEGRLLRTFDLPDPRTFATTVDAALSRSVADPVIDRLVGSGGAQVRSSARLFGDPALRGSQAFDIASTTAWVSTGTDPWVEARFPARSLDSVTLTPATGKVDGIAVRPALSARLTFSDGSSVDHPLGLGATRLAFSPRTTTSLRIALVAAPGAQATGLASVALGAGPALVTPGSVPSAKRCADLVTVDGLPVPMRTTATPRDLLAGAVGHYESCDAPRTLGSGAHTVSTGADWLVDRVLLEAPGASGGLAGSVAAPSGAPVTSVLAATSTSYSVSVGPGSQPSILVVGEPYDARWHATLGGRSLGAPLLLDGYAMGWWLPAGSGGVVTVSYGPQRILLAGVVLSGLALLGAALLLLRQRRRQGVAVAAVPAEPAGRRGAGRLRPAVALVAAGLGLFVLAGPLVLVVCGLASAAAAPWLPGWSRRTGVAGVALVALTPLAYLVGNLSRLGQVTPDLIAANLLPQVLAGAGVALVALAATWEVLGSRPVTGQPTAGVVVDG